MTCNCLVTGASGQIDLSTNGWPVQSYAGSDVVLSTDNDDDCLSLWSVLIEDGAEKGATNTSAEFIVNYEGSGVCSYILNADDQFGFEYDSTSGEVSLLF